MNKTLVNLEFRRVAVCFIFIFFSFLKLSFAQTYIESSTSQKLEETSNINPQMLALIGVETNTEVELQSIRGNTIFLKQIGDYNSISIKTQTLNSQINILQNGRNNITNLNYTSRTAFAEIKQLGNDNIVIDQFFSPNLDVSLELEQNGNDLNFVRDGVNELTKSLRFTQTNASPSLIIRSFN